MKSLRFVLPVLAAALVLASCAAKLPQADVDAANAAFAEATTAQAAALAADSFKVASDANDALQANLNAKDYGKTKALAKALLDASTKAKTDAATGLEAAKAEITQLGTDIAAEIPAIQKNLAKGRREEGQGRQQGDQGRPRRRPQGSRRCPGSHGRRRFRHRPQGPQGFPRRLQGRSLRRWFRRVSFFSMKNEKPPQGGFFCVVLPTSLTL